MKKYKVKLLEGHKAKDTDIVDGYLGNIFGNGRIATYDRGEAIKKANMFGGVTELAKGIHEVIGSLSIQTIPENALLDGVVKLLKGREAFKDASEMNEVIYQGDVFEEILGELEEIKKNHWIAQQPLQKVVDQLNELAELISADYVMVTQS